MKTKTTLAALCALALVGCGNLVGNNRMPDEMAVISGPALTLPPNFELRPPQEGRANKAQAIREASSSAEAQAILMGKDAGGKQADTGWLLEKAGADAANPDIRDMLESRNEEDE